MADAQWEERVDALWASMDDFGDDEAGFRSAVELLAAELPHGHPAATFEQACGWDSTGHSDAAIPLYTLALQQGLTGLRRRRAVIQLASSLRNLGRSAESVVLLEGERDRARDLLDAAEAELDDAVQAFLALALTDVGREREAASIAVRALAPHLKRYQRSAANYARLLVEPESDSEG